MARQNWVLCLPVLLILVALSDHFVNSDLELKKLDKNANSTESCIAKYCSVVDQKVDGALDKVKNGVTNGYKIPEDSLRHLSVLYGLFSVMHEAGLNELCHKEMTQVYEGVRSREIWAMKSESIEFCNS